MLAGSIPRVKRRQKKLVIGIITSCGSTCALIHMMSHGIRRVSIIDPTVITWAYQLVGMLPTSMCYTGGPCGTLKCALLAAIATPNRSTNFILYILTLNNPFSTMRGLHWHFALMRTPGDLGGGGVAERFLLDARVPVPIPEPSPSFGVTLTPSF